MASLPLDTSRCEARESAPMDDTPARGPKKLNYTHDAMIDQIIARPTISNGELAVLFGYTPPWVSTMKGSDAFRGRLEERRKELIDPSILLSIEDRLRAGANRSLEILQERLEGSPKDEFVLETAKLTLGAQGYGARADRGGAVVGVQVIVNTPGVAKSEGEWASRHAPAGAATLVEEVPRAADPLPIDHELRPAV